MDGVWLAVSGRRCERSAVSSIGDDGIGAPDLTIVEGWMMLYENYRLAKNAGFEQIEALWLVGCMVRGVPLPDWMVERLNKEDGD